MLPVTIIKTIIITQNQAHIGRDTDSSTSIT